MSALRLLKYGYLAYFSKPEVDRIVYRTIRRLRPATIVEIGVGHGLRTQRMLKQTLWYQPADAIRYVGIDLFEARGSDAPGLSLKSTHAALKPLGVKIQLVPGDPLSALSRVANANRNCDLVIISADQDAEMLRHAWFFLPRMLQQNSVVLVEERLAEHPAGKMRSLSLPDIQKLAAASPRALRRAA